MPRLDVIGVIVSNMDRSVDFHKRLGLQFPEDPDPEGHGHIEATLQGGLRFTQEADAPAAYVRALDLGVERLEQRYVRLDNDGDRAGLGDTWAPWSKDRR